MHVQEVLTSDIRRFDKGGDLFYEQISALHKSVRGSDPDAALYWFSRMLDGGCDPLYIARRVVRMASEDIGNADPRALQLALNAWDVQERLGSPEGELSIAQAVVYLSSAAKSNAVYNAYKAARSDVRELPSFDVPMHLRNAPTTLMKQLDFGKGYRYAHNEEEAFAAGESYFDYARGYDPVESDEIWRVGLSYEFPVLYPDFGIAGIVYFRRVRLRPFYDYMNADGASFASVGTEVLLDLNLFNVEPVSIGFRWAKRLDLDRGNDFALILPMGF
jgi:hypothetical protein